MMAAMMLAASLAPTTLYVSERGNDQADGRSTRTAFRTLERVRTELVGEAGKSPLRVELRGTLRLESTLVLGKEASGVEFVGRGAVISGGRLLGPWRAESRFGAHLWVADVPVGSRFRQLFDGSRRLTRSRYPKTGFLRLARLPDGADKAPWNEGQESAFVNAKELPAGMDWAGVDLLSHHFWVTSRLPIKSLDLDTGKVDFGAKSVFKLSDSYTGLPAPFALENVRETLSEPGEWALDAARGRVYLVPPQGARRESFQAVYPVADTLIRVDGARGVAFRNVEFRHSQHDFPTGISGSVQAAFEVPGALVLSDCADASVQTCTFRNLGTYAVELLGIGTKGASIQACRANDLGGGGIKIGHDTDGTTVEDCSFEGLGRDHASAVGIWIGNSGHNHIAHNRIRDLFYTGISVGWSWGYAPTKTEGNVIEFNEIRDVGQAQLSDMGGIYTLGLAPNSVLRNNRIDNVRSLGYGGWGIYFDEGTTGMLAENNVVSNTTTGGFHQHYGRDNVLRNNVFAFAQREGQVIRTRNESHHSFTFERNIVLFKGTPLVAGSFGEGTWTFAKNLFWKQDGDAELPPRDQGGLVADPLLGKDFLPTPASPAWKLGFRKIDLSKVGPRARR